MKPATFVTSKRTFKRTLFMKAIANPTVQLIKLGVILILGAISLQSCNLRTCPTYSKNVAPQEVKVDTKKC